MKRIGLLLLIIMLLTFTISPITVPSIIILVSMAPPATKRLNAKWPYAQRNDHGMADYRTSKCGESVVLHYCSTMKRPEHQNTTTSVVPYCFDSNCV